MSCSRVLCGCVCALLIITSPGLAQSPKAAPPHSGRPGVPDPRLPAPNATANGEPALGPLDPGPYPLMPGYFTRRATDLNDRQTPFFDGGGFSPYSGYGAGREYFPGVYPYYDAQYHYQWYQAHHREQQVRSRAEKMRDEGLEFFHTGDYESAAVRYLGAAELDQADAAARVHAGHCLFALGRYADALALLERAFELHPSLVYGGYDPRTDYGNRHDFTEQMQTLRDYSDQTPADAAAGAVLGYMTYFTDGTTRARPILEKARTLSPDETLVRRLLSVAKKASWNEDVVKSARHDTRTYDQMGVRPSPTVPYERARHPAPAKPKNDQKKPDSDDRLRRA